MNILFYVFFFFLGSAFASFLNVLVFGEKSVRKALKRKKSRCDSCNKTLVWWELIPIISWIFLYGRCSKCKKPIPLYHPVSEIILGSMFLATYHFFQQDLLLMYGYLLFVVISYFFSMYDIEKGIVPNRWIIPITGVTLLVIIIMGFFEGNFIQFVGLRVLTGIGHALFFVLMNFWSTSGFMPGVKKGKQGFGWGDAKYSPFIGLILGPFGTIVSCWIGVVSGAIVGLVIAYMVKKDKQKIVSTLAELRIPYVPFMTFGAWLAIFWGQVVMNYFIDIWRF